MLFNATFNNISVISWLSVLLKETGIPEENYRPAVSHSQHLSHNVVSSTPRHKRDSNTLATIGTDCTGSCKSNFHRTTITTTPCVFLVSSPVVCYFKSSWLLSSYKLKYCVLMYNFHVITEGDFVTPICIILFLLIL
jgi:hypothetical protein